jgi:5-methyltetrahydropteroyltriglutamate--homocysteine methyltransferase
MTIHSPAAPPFRADHVGSLLRPAVVHQARAQAQRGAIAAAELRVIEDEAILQAVALQQAIGLRSVTDGEFPRGHFLLDFLTGLEGIVPTQGQYAVAFKGEHGERGETRSMLQVNAKIRRTRPISVDDFRFLNAATIATAKLCIPSPTYIHMRGGRSTVGADIYPDIEEFWNDLIHAYHAEIADLAVAGCRYLQIDIEVLRC